MRTNPALMEARIWEQSLVFEDQRQFMAPVTASDIVNLIVSGRISSNRAKVIVNGRELTAFVDIEVIHDNVVDLEIRADGLNPVAIRFDIFNVENLSNLISEEAGMYLSLVTDYSYTFSSES